MEPGSFVVVPTVYLRKRKLVRADGAPTGEDVVPAVRSLAAKGLVCIVDLDGLARNKADLDTLRKVADKGNVWVDAGSRYATDAMDLIVAGAERVTLRWSALVDEEELREAQAVSDALVLGLEFDGAFQAHPKLGGEARAQELARELGLDVAVLDLARAGSVAGADRALAARFQSTGLPRWFAGGVRDMTDARELEALGYKGCLVAGPWREGGSA
ncbi:MAG TPA: HisA/HisF-related TIM barrel protein [Candidatus Thermoplasmatota archaeon]|nr:HisA/HisF-related TIM barrel protein [Candidatus Thermoplasmatota archaeon]